MTIKLLKDVIDTVKLDNDIIETGAEKRFPYFDNRYDSFGCNVLQKIRVHEFVMNSAHLLSQGYCCILTVVEIEPNEFIIDIFLKGFPQTCILMRVALDRTTWTERSTRRIN